MSTEVDPTESASTPAPDPGSKSKHAPKPRANHNPTAEGEPKPAVSPKQECAHPASSVRGAVTFSSTKANFAEWYEELMITADIVDKHWDVKGMPVLLPYGYSMHQAIMGLFEEEYGKIGIKQCQFPAFIPKVFLEKEADHVKAFVSECFWYKDEMCLRPTSETAMYSMFSRWVKSVDDLPLMVHQSCSVWRYETKNTKPLIRVREIPWNEAHTAHSTPSEAIELLEDCWRIVHRVLTDHLSIDGLRLRRPDWDRFPGADYTDVLDVVMPCGRVLQTIGAHYLGQHFSSVFNISFNGENAYMTCTGVSTRALAAVLSAHGDDKGLILPSVIAPIQVIVIPIVSKTSLEEVTDTAERIRNELKTLGLRVRVDASGRKRPGDKFFYYEMKGVPLRIEIGANDIAKGHCTLKVRGLEDRMFAPLAEVGSICLQALGNFDAALRERARVHLMSRTVDCSTPSDIAGILSLGGFARIPYFTMGKEGADEAQRLRERCGGEIRGYRPMEKPPDQGVKCIVTGLPAKYWAYVARAY